MRDSYLLNDSRWALCCQVVPLSLYAANPVLDRLWEWRIAITRKRQHY